MNRMDELALLVHMVDGMQQSALPTGKQRNDKDDMRETD